MDLGTSILRNCNVRVGIVPATLVGSFVTLVTLVTMVILLILVICCFWCSFLKYSVHRTGVRTVDAAQERRFAEKCWTARATGLDNSTAVFRRGTRTRSFCTVFMLTTAVVAGSCLYIRPKLAGAESADGRAADDV